MRFGFDLLKADELRRYAVRPESLRQELDASDIPPLQVVIDEVQKVPALLDEVHWLMDSATVTSQRPRANGCTATMCTGFSSLSPWSEPLQK